MIYTGDALTVLRGMSAGSVHCCVTSPPYWGLRDYGVKEQIGLERSPEEYTARLVEVFREVRRVLRDDATLWLNLGDSYAATTKGSGGHTKKQDSNAGSFHSNRQWAIPTDLKPKDLVGIPWRVAFALQADGWWLRSDIIWHKPNPMPESVTDRPTKAHEYIFLLTKSEKYWYDAAAIAEPCTDVEFRTVGKIRPDTSRDAHWFSDPHKGRTRANLHNMPGGRSTRNRRTVWTIGTRPYKGAHFATFPPKLVEPCIIAGCPKGGTVLDPFAGAGTVGLVAAQHGRESIGIELNAAYVKLAHARLKATA